MPTYIHSDSVAKGCKRVSDCSTQVRINEERLRSFIRESHDDISRFANSKDQGRNDYVIPGIGEDGSMNLAFVAASLNFSYWLGRDTTWSFSHDGTSKSGSSALMLALRTSIEEGSPMHDAEFLSKLRYEQLAKAMDGGYATIPMLGERLSILNENGKVLLDKYDGKFSNVVSRAGDAIGLVNLLATDFPSFLDYSDYGEGSEKTPVYLMKRAQLLVWNLSQSFQLAHDLEGIDKLTAFADYKVPMVLRRPGILELSGSLAEKIDKGITVRHGSAEEVEIRCCTVTAVETGKKELKEEFGMEASSAMLDSYLWLLGRERMHGERHMLCRTTAY